MKRANIVYLPQEIMEEILSRLPVRSLLRLRCVSKSWRCLIGSKRFIQTHLIQNSNHRRIIVDFVGPSYTKLKQLRQCSNHEPGVDSFAFDNHINANINRDSIYLVGCCNGLVCILLDRKYFVLWNPCTRISKKLPANPIDYELDSYTKYGLGYDKSSDDYKVVVIGIRDIPRRPWWRAYQIHRIYSLKTNSWKTLKGIGCALCFFRGAGKYASGNLHWCRSQGYGCLGLGKGIAYFDLKSEARGLIELPSCLEVIGSFRQTLGVMGGCLSVLCDYFDTGRLDVWIMKEYGVKESWAKLVALSNFPYPPIGEREGSIRLFCTLPNGEILLLYNYTFVIYYPKDNVFRHCKSIDVDLLTEADVCIESLVPLASEAEPAV